MILAPIVIGVILTTGFVLGAYVLRLRDGLAVLGMTALGGTVLYLICVNTLGYVLPIRTAMIVSVALLGCATFIVIARVAATDNLRLKLHFPRPLILWSFAGIAAITAFANMRFAGSDPWAWQHYPLAATIAAGNFPVQNPIDPDHFLYYHYGAALLAASFCVLTGLPLVLGFLLQPIAGAFGLLCFAGALAKRITKSDRAVLPCAALAFAGMGLPWLKIFSEPPSFALLAQLFSSPITVSPLVFFGHRSVVLGFPMVYGLMFLLGEIFGKDNGDSPRPKKRGQSPFSILAAFLFALALTLTMESAFVAILVAIDCFILFLLLFGKSRQWRTVLGASLLIFVPATLIALVHGGVLSGVLHPIVSTPAFKIVPSVRVTYDSFANTVAFWQWPFVRDFGVPLLLLPFACVYAWHERKDASKSLLFLLLMFGLLHLVLPFIVLYEAIPGEMRRLFYMATSIFAFLAGIVIDAWLLRGQNDLRGFRTRTSEVILGWALIGSMLVSSSIYLATRLVIPTMRWEQSPLLAAMQPVMQEQEELFAWVRENTSLDDRFYIRSLPVNFHDVPEHEAQQRDRVLFMTNTGRFTVGPVIFWDHDPLWLVKVRKVELTCDSKIFHDLGVRYLVIETEDRARWFDNTCHSTDWKVRYEGGRQYPRIYELNFPSPLRGEG